MRILVSFIFIFFSSVLFAFGTTEDPTSTEDPNLKEAQSLIEKKEFDKAVPLLMKVVTSNPKNADAFNYLGYSYRQLGKQDEALKNYQMALSIDPAHKGANEYLGELYIEKGELPKAQEQLMVLEKLCPSDCVEHKTLKAKIEAAKSNKGASEKSAY